MKYEKLDFDAFIFTSIKLLFLPVEDPSFRRFRIQVVRQALGSA